MGGSGVAVARLTDMDFGVSLRPEHGRLVVAVRGELDEASGHSLRATVADALREQYDAVVFDLSGVSFMDSRGLGQFLSACTTVDEAGSTPYVAEPSVHARRVLDTAGLTERLREPGS